MTRPGTTDAVLDPRRFPLVSLYRQHNALMREAAEIREDPNKGPDWVERHKAVLAQASALLDGAGGAR